MRISDKISMPAGGSFVRFCTGAIVLGALMVGNSRTANAQMPAPMVMPQGAPVQWGSIPQNFEPYPRISPFDHAFQQHSNDNGLWFSESIGTMSAKGQRRYFFGMEYLSTKTKSEEGIFGSGGAQSYYELVYDDLVDAVDDDYADDFRFFNYYSALDLKEVGDISGSGMRFTTGWWNMDDSGFVAEVMWNADSDAIFDARSASTTRNAFGSLATVTGDLDSVNNRFGSGVSELDLVRELLSPGPGDNDYFEKDDNGLIDPFDADELIQRNLLNLRGIPVDNGTFAGTTIPYDLGYHVAYSSEMVGTSLAFVMTPVVKSKAFMVRPVVGARYMYVDENLNFRGVDSGAVYDGGGLITDVADYDLKLQSLPNGVDEDDDGLIDPGTIDEDGNAFDVDNITLVGGNDQDDDDVSGFTNVIDAYLQSRAQSHLAGPEIGLRYDLGSEEGFKLSGHTKIGLLFNRERLDLEGDNIGMTTSVFEETVPEENHSNGLRDELFSPEDPLNVAAGGTLNQFSDSDATTHVSPLLEQAVNAEIPIFEFVPVLNRLRAFENANLKVGYSITFIGELASTNNSIRWQANPQANLFPGIDVERRNWWTSNWSIGLQWRF